jgi:dynein heavy chain
LHTRACCAGGLARNPAARPCPPKVIRDTATEMKLAPDDDFVLRVVQLSELLAIRHCVFLMGPTGCGRTECYRVRRADCGGAGESREGGGGLRTAAYWRGRGAVLAPRLLPLGSCPPLLAPRRQVLARAIAHGTGEPVNDYLKMTNKKKVVVRDIDPKAVSTQELYGFVNMATREWKVRRGEGGRGWEGVRGPGACARPAHQWRRPCGIGPGRGR